MDFKSALNKICQDFNKDIIFERRVISILDDYGAFKDVPYYKLFYKTALSSGNLINLISQNDNIRNKEIYTFVSLTGLDENKMKLFLSIIYECYYEIIQKPINNIKDSEDNNVSPKIDNSALTSNPHSATNGDHIVFMGKELGCNFQEMIDYLAGKGFDSQPKNFFLNLHDNGHPKVYGTFAGFENATIVLWPTKLGSIWHVVVTIKADYQFIKKLFKQKYNNIKEVRPSGKLSLGRCLVDVNGGSIQITEKSYGIRIAYTDTITEEIHKNELTIEKGKRITLEEIKKQMQIQKGLADI